MEMNCHLKPSVLQEDVSRLFGTDYRIRNSSRMHGGAQKVVYKIECSNKFTCVLYVWDLAASYFQEEQTSPDINGRWYGSDLFEMNTKFLTQHGIRTPILYYLNTERQQCHLDYALVEYVEGQKAEDYFQHTNPLVQDQIFQQLGDMLSNMHAIQRAGYGKLNHEAINEDEKCHLIQLKDAESLLGYASHHLDSINNNHHKLLDTLHKFEANICSRASYGFIHWELGPDHVLVNDALEPVLIDIEGAMFYDLEYEHSFLEFRFGQHYRFLKNTNLDAQRMLFYRFYHHISLVTGGLKLLHRGFPNQQFAKGLIEYHLKSLLRYIVV